jgi:hypothetical protein
MGMFDSFYVDGEEYQTKELDCCLMCYNLGDTVPNLGGVSNYHMIIGHDKKIGIIVIDNIFIKHCPPEDVDHIFKTFMTDARICQDALIRILKANNTQLYYQGRKLVKISNALNDYNRFTTKGDNWVFNSRTYERFVNGESLYDVLKSEIDS